MDAKDGDHQVHRKEFPRIFPGTSGAIPADSMSASTFRSKFLSVVANDITKMFISYPPEEKHMLE